jgi:tetratricopeptide (TPR) repeat protein
MSLETAEALAAEGKYKEAIPHFEQAVKSNPNNATVRLRFDRFPERLRFGRLARVTT